MLTSFILNAGKRHNKCSKPPIIYTSGFHENMVCIRDDYSVGLVAKSGKYGTDTTVGAIEDFQLEYTSSMIIGVLHRDIQLHLITLRHCYIPTTHDDFVSVGRKGLWSTYNAKCALKLLILLTVFWWKEMITVVYMSY